eukprot:1605545-Pyramimonas_sp.AAC.1
MASEAWDLRRTFAQSGPGALPGSVTANMVWPAFRPRRGRGRPPGEAGSAGAPGPGRCARHDGEGPPKSCRRE